MPSDDELKVLVQDPTLSFWFKEALTSALARDPLDASADSALLAMVLEKRAAEITASAQAQIAIAQASKQ